MRGGAICAAVGTATPSCGASSRIPLLRTLELLPEHLWPKSRRKRDYVSGVLGAGGGRIGLPAGAQALETSRDRLLRACTGPEVAPHDGGRRNAWTSIAEAMNLAAVADGRRRVVFRRSMASTRPRRRGPKPRRPGRRGFDQTRRSDQIMACLKSGGASLKKAAAGRAALKHHCAALRSARADESALIRP